MGLEEGVQRLLQPLGLVAANRQCLARVTDQQLEQPEPEPDPDPDPDPEPEPEPELRQSRQPEARLESPLEQPP